MICEKWFPTPIWVGQFENVSDDQYTGAIQYCRDLLVKNPTGKQISNIGGWQSSYLYSQDIGSSPLSIFFDQLKPKCDQALLELGVKTEYNFSNSWININRKGSYHLMHDHAGSNISGVFYLTKNNSKIVFDRNNDIARHHLKWMSSDESTPLSYTRANYNPRQGQFILFPSWLFHMVEPHISEEERISISFNFS